MYNVILGNSSLKPNQKTIPVHCKAGTYLKMSLLRRLYITVRHRDIYPTICSTYSIDLFKSYLPILRASGTVPPIKRKKSASSSSEDSSGIK